MTAARIEPLRDPTGAVAELLGKTLAGPGDGPLNVFATLARHPRLLKRFNALGGLFVVHGELPERERELVVLRTAWTTRSEYEWGQHVLLGRRAGVTDAEMARLTGPVEGTGWATDDAALLDFVDELLSTSDVSDERWAVQRERWSDAQLLELVMLAGFYRMLAGFLNAVRVQPDGDLPGWPSDQQPQGETGHQH